jgi:hypothetical protein
MQMSGNAGKSLRVNALGTSWELIGPGTDGQVLRYDSNGMPQVASLFPSDAGADPAGAAAAAYSAAVSEAITEITLNSLSGVPTSRSITINGTAQDLSADRSWTVSGSAAAYLFEPDANGDYQPVSASPGAFDADVNGDLEPPVGNVFTDPKYELDSNGDIQPQA